MDAPTLTMELGSPVSDFSVQSIDYHRSAEKLEPTEYSEHTDDL